MRVFAWLIFLVIIIGGIVSAVNFAEQKAGIAAIVVIGSFIMAFLSVAGIMIFLDLARNVMLMKEKLCSKKEDGNTAE